MISDDEAAALERDEVLNGLHAKLFVIDRGWDASVFSGSFNATVHALEHNVEFMVELVGKKSRFGVDQFLRQAKGETTFSDLLKEYDRNAASVPTDTTAQQLDDLIWDKPSIRVRSICRLDPLPSEIERPPRPQLKELLATAGWLTPVKTHRYDKRELQIIRGG